MLLMKDMKPHYKRQKFECGPEVIDSLKINASGGIGFPFNNKRWPPGTKKKDVVAEAKSLLHRVVEELALGTSIYDLLAVSVAKILIKSEIRTFLDEEGKVRVIGQHDILTHFITAILSAPWRKRLEKQRWCALGHSMFSTMVNSCMYAIGHPDYLKYRIGCQNPGFIVQDGPCFILQADLSAQDYTFTAFSLFLTLQDKCKFFDLDGMTDKERKVYFGLFLYEQISTHHKIVEWFNGAYYHVTGVMVSGYGDTSHGDTKELHLAYLVLFALLLKERYDKWWQHLKFLLDVVYGDDSIVAIPDRYLDLFCSDLNPVGNKLYPDKMVIAAKLIGLNFKKEETYILVRTEEHLDPFYSTVVNDQLVQEGVKFLQRYFVKTDEYGHLLPADAPKWHRVAPWRLSFDYFPRAVNHINNWDHPTKNKTLAFFQKVFGLLIDAGLNYTVHCFLKRILLRIEELCPGIVEWAVVAMDLAEMRIKYPEIHNGLVRELMSANSFAKINLMFTASNNSAILRWNYLCDEF